MRVTIDLDDPQLLEALADAEHARWSRWENWRREHATPDAEARWRDQSATAYADLPEHSKESDRKEARITLAILQRHGITEEDTP